MPVNLNGASNGTTLLPRSGSSIVLRVDRDAVFEDQLIAKITSAMTLRRACQLAILRGRVRQSTQRLRPRSI